jgi:hypothetical protein
MPEDIQDKLKHIGQHLHLDADFGCSIKELLESKDPMA